MPRTVTGCRERPGVTLLPDADGARWSKLSDRCTVAPIPRGHPTPLPPESTPNECLELASESTRCVLEMDQWRRARTDLNGFSWAAREQDPIQSITSQKKSPA